MLYEKKLTLSKCRLACLNSFSFYSLTDLFFRGNGLLCWEEGQHCWPCCFPPCMYLCCDIYQIDLPIIKFLCSVKMWSPISHSVKYVPHYLFVPLSSILWSGQNIQYKNGRMNKLMKDSFLRTFLTKSLRWRMKRKK